MTDCMSKLQHIVGILLGRFLIVRMCADIALLAQKVAPAIQHLVNDLARLQKLEPLVQIVRLPKFVQTNGFYRFACHDRAGRVHSRIIAVLSILQRCRDKHWKGLELEDFWLWPKYVLWLAGFHRTEGPVTEVAGERDAFTKIAGCQVVRARFPHPAGTFLGKQNRGLSESVAMWTFDLHVQCSFRKMTVWY